MIEELTKFVEHRSTEFMESSIAHGHGFSPNVLIFRGGEQVAAVMMETGAPRDKILSVALMAIGGWGADVLALTFDSYFSPLENNPGTGRPWEPGEMETMLRKHKGFERGWVSDALMSSVMNVAGDWTLTTMPYSVTNKRVKWGKIDRFDSEHSTNSPVGYMAEILQKAMATPPVPIDMNEFPGATFDEARTFMDCMTARLVSGIGGMVAMVAPSDPKLNRLMSRIMESMGIEYDISAPTFTDN